MRLMRSQQQLHWHKLCDTRCMIITAVRHGETNENAQDIVQGQSYGTLSLRGLEQIAALSRTLRTEAFDYIFTSDLERCVVTATAIADNHRAAAFVEDPRLRERSMQPEEGKTFAELNWSYADVFHPEHKTADGESWFDVLERVRGFFDELRSLPVEARVLLVTHGGPIRALASLAESKPLTETLPLDIPNCSIWQWQLQLRTV